MCPFHISKILPLGTNPGGGGGVLAPIFGRYVPRQSENVGLLNELEGENAGLRSELERESGGSPELTVGRVWLALWPAANSGALPERFALGLAAVSRPWAAMNGLKLKRF